jgi:putative transposase
VVNERGGRQARTVYELGSTRDLTNCGCCRLRRFKVFGVVCTFGQAIADVRETKADLIAENALLRQQLIAAKRHLRRPKLAKPEKLAITLWARLTNQWQSTFLLFQPDTILRWHREMFRIVWWRKSRAKSNSRARLDSEAVKLIMEMARDNRRWGAERIRGE